VWSYAVDLRLFEVQLRISLHFQTIQMFGLKGDRVRRKLYPANLRTNLGTFGIDFGTVILIIEPYL